MLVIAMMILSRLSSAVQAQSNQSLVGRIVVPKTSDFVLRHGDQVTNRLITKISCYRVDKVDGPTMSLAGPGVNGWAPADQLVAFDEAEEYFTKQIRLKPRNAFSYVVRGMVRAEKNQEDLALADFAQAIQLDRSAAVAYFCRGEVLGKKGEHEKSGADFSEFIKLEPREASLTSFAAIHGS